MYMIRRCVEVDPGKQQSCFIVNSTSLKASFTRHQREHVRMRPTSSGRGVFGTIETATRSCFASCVGNLVPYLCMNSKFTVASTRLTVPIDSNPTLDLGVREKRYQECIPCANGRRWRAFVQEGTHLRRRARERG